MTLRCEIHAAVVAGRAEDVCKVSYRRNASENRIIRGFELNAGGAMFETYPLPETGFVDGGAGSSSGGRGRVAAQGGHRAHRGRDMGVRGREDCLARGRGGVTAPRRRRLETVYHASTFLKNLDKNLA